MIMEQHSSSKSSSKKNKSPLAGNMDKNMDSNMVVFFSSRDATLTSTSSRTLRTSYSLERSTSSLNHKRGRMCCIKKSTTIGTTTMPLFSRLATVMSIMLMVSLLSISSATTTTTTATTTTTPSAATTTPAAASTTPIDTTTGTTEDTPTTVENVFTTVMSKDIADTGEDLVTYVMADQLRDHMGQCFDASRCSLRSVGAQWTVNTSCERAECYKTQNGTLVEKRTRCSDVPSSMLLSDACYIVRVEGRIFPQCCPKLFCDSKLVTQGAK